MFEYLIGKLGDASPEKIALEVGGIGYRVWVSIATYEELPKIGKEVKIYTSVVVREDSERIFGFVRSRERDFFDTLCDISGIGPRLAIAILGHMRLEDLLIAVEHANAKAISSIPGIGKKMAERLILELKDKRKKIEKENIALAEGEVATVVGDAISALIHLGYAPIEAQKAVQHASKTHSGELPLAQLISLSLKSDK